MIDLNKNFFSYPSLKAQDFPKKKKFYEVIAEVPKEDFQDFESQYAPANKQFKYIDSSSQASYDKKRDKFKRDKFGRFTKKK